jgi:hypothetical protein
MKSLFLAALGFAVLAVLPKQAVPKIDVICPRSITPGEACPPAVRTKAALVADKSVGASVMIKNYWVQSLGDEDVVCDIVRFSLKNTGSDVIQLTVPVGHEEAPFLYVEGMIDGKWTAVFPIHSADGQVRYISPPSYRYASRTVTVKPGDQFSFPVNIERWRYSVSPMLRIALNASVQGSKEGEVIYSNSISVKS